MLRRARRQPKVKEADWLMCLDVDEFWNIRCGDNSFAALIAETEQADSTAAAQLIWRSTLIAMITIPIWAWLLKTMAERLGT